MSDSRADELYHKWQSSTEQFDYFIMALICAVVAYVANALPSGSLTSVTYIIQVLSILALLGSMYAGFIQLESKNQCTRFNHQILHALETRGKMVDAKHGLLDGKTVFNSETGAYYSLEGVEKAMIKQTANAQKFAKELEALAPKCKRAYDWRNRLFLFGLVGIVVSKAIASYVP